jgi:hypothetical protein
MNPAAACPLRADFIFNRLPVWSEYMVMYAKMKNRGDGNTYIPVLRFLPNCYLDKTFADL